MELLDLPKRIDAFVDGAITLAYSCVGDFARLWLRPVRTSLHLSQVTRNGVSSTTLLLIASAVVASVQGNFSDEKLAGLTNGGSAYLSRFIALLAVAYLAGDLLGRAVGRLAARKGRRRSRATRMARYAVAATALIYAVGIGLFFHTWQEDRADPLHPSHFSVMGAPILAILSVYPFMAVSTGVLRRRLPRWPLLRWPIVAMATAVCMVFLVGGVTLVGLFIDDYARTLFPTPSGAGVLAVNCTALKGGGYAITGAIVNRGDRTAAFRSDDFWLQLVPVGAPRSSELTEARDVNLVGENMLILSKDGGATVHFISPAPKPPAVEFEQKYDLDQCSLFYTSGGRLATERHDGTWAWNKVVPEKDAKLETVTTLPP